MTFQKPPKGEKQGSGASEMPNPPPIPSQATNLPLNPFDFLLRQPIRHATTTTAPTFVPKNWAECFQAFDDGVDRGLHVYINGTWRTITAT